MMAKSMGQRDQQPSEVYADLKTQWVRQTVAYVRSVRLYQERVRERRDRQLRSRGRATRMDLTAQRQPASFEIVALPSVEEALPPLDRMAPPPARPEGDRHDGQPSLTARQLEVAQLIARGLTNAQIADELVLSRGTVGNHIGQMLRRLGVKNRAELAAWVIRYNDQRGQAEESPPREKDERTWLTW